jgi:hypothetical protein
MEFRISAKLICAGLWSTRFVLGVWWVLLNFKINYEFAECFSSCIESKSANDIFVEVVSQFG